MSVANGYLTLIAALSFQHGDSIFAVPLQRKSELVDLMSLQSHSYLWKLDH